MTAKAWKSGANRCARCRMTGSLVSTSWIRASPCRKRHAVLSVDKQGNCSVRDLHSTNGSFVVTNNGQLMRLPAGEDIKLPIDSMTLQFGDVRLTLESAFEHDDEDDDATSGVSDDTSQSRFRTCSNTRSPTRLRRNRMQPTCPWTTSSICVPASRRRSSTRAMSPDRADALHQAERQTFTPEHADKPELEDAFPSVSLVQGNRRGRGQAPRPVRRRRSAGRG